MRTYSGSVLQTHIHFPVMFKLYNFVLDFLRYAFYLRVQRFVNALKTKYPFPG
ncbi:hypothetical protein VIBNISOn1_p0035 [Vibrio nigripulchritudo SOn1]|uniref:Transposase n=1 Tax=Vibrio nigripulchritudo SOn1 TaxID=1238450 RepID=A0AAV2VZY4_9VIBR|nr:hypothetical protein VIBNISOn1_p0035 [Vibrio nigripulchritudo SOn1]